MINDNVMLGVPVGDTFAENLEFNLYDDAKKSVYGYLGLYKDKKICAVGKIVKVVTVKFVGGEFQFDSELTPDERDRFLNYRKRCELRGSAPVPMTKIFFVDNFYRTNYKNIGKMGIMGSKKFFLDKLLPATTEEIAEQLDGQEWQLGNDIIPEKKSDGDDDGHFTSMAGDF